MLLQMFSNVAHDYLSLESQCIFESKIELVFKFFIVGIHFKKIIVCLTRITKNLENH